MLDKGVRRIAEDFAAAFRDETGLGTAWALLWLISKAERHAEVLALIADDDDDDAAAGETLREWAEPRLVAFRGDEEIPTIAWRRVVRILQHLPGPADEG